MSEVYVVLGGVPDIASESQCVNELLGKKAREHALVRKVSDCEY